MEHKKYKILVLSDLKDSTSTILKNTVGFEKMIDGQIEFFHVKKATDIVYRESQLSAVRNIRDEYIAIDKKVNDIINPFEKEHGKTIKKSISFGNVKQEIDNYISKSNPDIIVMGKRKSSILKLDRDSVTNFVLSKFKGSVLLLTDDNQLGIDKKLSLGLLNASNQSINIDFLDSLKHHSQKPLKSFSIVNKSNIENNTLTSNSNTVNYVFEAGSNSLNNLSNYVIKNNINLLCLEREQNKNEININDTIKKVDVSLLLTANNNVAVK